MLRLFIMFKKTDLFGKNFIFEEEENQKFTTKLGMIVTLLIIVTCIVFGFLSGKEIYERKNPSVLNSDEKLAKSTIRMNEYPLFFGFSDGPGNSIPSARNHINLELTQLNFTEKSEASIYYYSEYKKCDVSDYSETYQSYVQNLYATYGQYFDLYCILLSDDLYFENEYTTPGSSFINVRFKMCNPNIQECGDIEERNNIMKDLYIIMFYINTYIDSGDYTNPINYYPTNRSQKVSEGLLQRLYVNIEKIKLVTHKGWLFEDIVENEILNVRSFTKDATTENDGNLYWITLSSPNIRSKIIRTYMKIQDMFAKIGGFYNALFILASIFSKNYIDFSFYQYIYKYFYKFKNPIYSSTRSTKSLVNKHTIDKIVKKLAVSDLYLNVNDKSKIFEEGGLTHKSISKIDIKDFSKNQVNLEYPQFNSSYINNNNLNNNNNNDNLNNNFKQSNNNNQSGMVNNFINNNKDLQKPDNENIQSPIEIKESKLNINYNSQNLNKISNNDFKSTLKTLDSIKFLDNYSNDISYFSYIWNDIICCRDKFKFQKQAVKKVISFENLMEVNYEHYLKTDANAASNNN